MLRTVSLVHNPGDSGRDHSSLDLITKAVARIPCQLQRPEFRFVPIWSGEKKPFEHGWNRPGGANYPYDSPKLAAYLLEGHNYGACAGMGDLIIFDSDHPRLAELGILDDLPPTFTVRTGGGGTHRYYLCRDIEHKAVMYDRELKNEKGEPLHLGEIQTLGFQAVCPGSLHPNGKRYTVEIDAPIAEITWPELYAILEGKIEFGLAPVDQEPKKKHFAIKVTDPRREDPFEDVSLETVLYPRGNLRRSGSIIKGEHPVHGSTHGHNFQIDTRKNTWFCFRCWKGGGPALAVAVSEGILRCNECGPGVLRGDLFTRTLEAARERGLIREKKPLMKVERWTA